MSLDSIPQISLGTAALIIFLICAGFVMLRGMTRMLAGTVVLALSAWLSFQVWQKAPELSVEWTGKSIDAITYGLTAASFLISFFLIHKIAKLIIHPFDRKADDAPSKPFSFTRLAFRLLLALVPTSIICLIGATLIHHTGSIAELRAFSEETPDLDEPAHTQYVRQLKTSVEAALPESWLKTLDPLTESSRLALAKAITAQSSSPLEPAIHPQTGEPIPRAIIVDDPELQTLARKGKFGTLLRHPLLTQALDDPKVQSLLKDLHH